MISKAVALITIQNLTIQNNWFKVYHKMLTVSQLSIKDNQMLSNVLIAYQNKVAKLTLGHKVLNNHHKQWGCLKNLVSIIWEAIIAIIDLANKIILKFKRRKLMYQETWVQICHHNLAKEGLDSEVLTTEEIWTAPLVKVIATASRPMDK